MAGEMIVLLIVGYFYSNLNDILILSLKKIIITNLLMHIPLLGLL